MQKDDTQRSLIRTRHAVQLPRLRCSIRQDESKAAHFEIGPEIGCSGGGGLRYVVSENSSTEDPAIRWGERALTALQASASCKSWTKAMPYALCVDCERFLLFVDGKQGSSLVFVAGERGYVESEHTPDGDLLALSTRSAIGIDIAELEYFTRPRHVPTSAVVPRKRLLLRRGVLSELVLEADSAEVLHSDAENWLDVCTLIIHLYKLRIVPSTGLRVCIPAIDAHYLAVPGRGMFAGGARIGAQWSQD